MQFVSAVIRGTHLRPSSLVGLVAHQTRLRLLQPVIRRAKMAFQVELTSARAWSDEQMNALFAQGFPAFIVGDQDVKQQIGRVREFFPVLLDDCGYVDTFVVPFHVERGIPFMVAISGALRSACACRSESQFPRRTPLEATPFTRVIPFASSGASSPLSAASTASLRTAVIRTLIETEPSPRASSATRQALTVALVNPGRGSWTDSQAKNSSSPRLYTRP